MSAYEDLHIHEYFSGIPFFTREDALNNYEFLREAMLGYLPEECEVFQQGPIWFWAAFSVMTEDG